MSLSFHFRDIANNITLCGKSQCWDEDKEEFITSYGPVKLQLEHSLISLSKWEQKWHKPYLSTEKDKEMLIDYIRCMTIGKVDPEVYNHISPKNIDEVGEYLSDPMTATCFNDKKVGGAPARTGKLNGEVIYGDISHIDNLTMTGNLRVGGTTTSLGKMYANNGLEVNGNTTIDGTLGVSGTATFSSDVIANRNLTDEDTVVIQYTQS